MSREAKYPEPKIQQTYRDYLKEHRKGKPNPSHVVNPFGKHANMDLHGPLNVTDFYPDYRYVGHQYESQIPADRPLPEPQMQWLRTNYPAVDARAAQPLDPNEELLRGLRFTGRDRWGNWVLFASHRRTPVRCLCKVIQMPGPSTPYAGTKLQQDIENSREEIPFPNQPDGKPDQNNPYIALQGSIEIPDLNTAFPYAFILAFTEVGKMSLGDVIGRGIRLHENVCGLWFSQIADAVRHLHNKLNGAHTDIRPHNIAIHRTPNGFTFRLCDFGKAIIGWGHEDQPMTTYGLFSFYKPPEARNLGAIFPAKPWDIYALGRTLYDVIHSGSAETADLIRQMIDPNPRARITIAQVKSHQWVQRFPLRRS